MNKPFEMRTEIHLALYSFPYLVDQIITLGVTIIQKCRHYTEVDYSDNNSQHRAELLSYPLFSALSGICT